MRGWLILPPSYVFPIMDSWFILFLHHNYMCFNGKSDVLRSSSTSTTVLNCTYDYCYCREYFLYTSKTKELFEEQNDTRTTKRCHAFTHTHKDRTDELNLLDIVKAFNDRRMHFMTNFNFLFSNFVYSSNKHCMLC